MDPQKFLDNLRIINLNDITIYGQGNPITLKILLLPILPTEIEMGFINLRL